MKQAMQAYLLKYETPANLLQTLADLESLRAVAADRLDKVDKELKALKKIFGDYEKN